MPLGSHAPFPPSHKCLQRRHHVELQQSTEFTIKPSERHPHVHKVLWAQRSYTWCRSHRASCCGPNPQFLIPDTTRMATSKGNSFSHRGPGRSRATANALEVQGPSKMESRAPQGHPSSLITDLWLSHFKLENLYLCPRSMWATLFLVKL